MVLVYDRMIFDPRITRLEAGPALVYLAATSACNIAGRETVSVSEIEAVRTSTETDTETAIGELVKSELMQRLPHGHVKVLGRLDLWAFEDDDVDW